MSRVEVLVDRFDRIADRPFERLRGHPLADRVFYGASEAANFSLLWHGLAWAPVLVAPRTDRVLRACRVSAALAAESALVNGPVRSVFHRQRPTLDLDQSRPHRLRTPRTSSFPSGHASAAVVAAMTLGARRPLPVRAGLALVGAVVSTSRIHVRIHHASDVAGGLVVGYGLGRLLRRVLRL